MYKIVTYYKYLVTLYFGDQFSLLTICLNKLLICCLLIADKAVVKFSYEVN